MTKVTGAGETPAEVAAAADAMQRWRALHTAATNDPAEQARLDIASRLADATVAGSARAGWLRPHASPGLEPVIACEAWSRIALLWHRVLTETDAFATARANTAASCHLDPEEVRAWLDRPAGDTADDDATVGDRLLGAEFGLSAFHKWTHISNLIAEAQNAGVLQVPGHRIDILHLANERGFIDRHRITLTTPTHGTICSPDIDTLDLLTDHLSGTDAALHLLTVVAEETDHLLIQRALLADIPVTSARAFAPITIDGDNAVPSTGATEPARYDGRRHR